MQNNKIDLSDLGMSEEELFTEFDNTSSEAEKITAPRYSYWRSVFRVFFRKKTNIFMLALLVLVFAMAYIYPMISGYVPASNVLDPSTQHMSPAVAIERWGFSVHSILGTNALGDSVFDSVWHGAEISLSLAVVCAVINLTVGVIIGAIWGFSKAVDRFMTEVYNVIGNLPTILIVSVLVMIFRPSFWTLVFSLTVTGWLFIAYFIRTQVIIIRDREYNLASRCLGTPTLRIAMKNILPFMTSVIVTMAATEVPSYISSEVFLSYIGLGMSEETLGKIIEQAQSAMQTPGRELEFWAPVIVSAIITVVLYVVGQSLGDASDPRTHM